jgi:hypothetical protein
VSLMRWLAEEGPHGRIPRSEIDRVVVQWAYGVTGAAIGRAAKAPVRRGSSDTGFVASHLVCLAGVPLVSFEFIGTRRQHSRRADEQPDE